MNILQTSEDQAAILEGFAFSMVEERLYPDLQIDQAYAVADLRRYRTRNIVVTQVPEQQAPSP